MLDGKGMFLAGQRECRSRKCPLLPLDDRERAKRVPVIRAGGGCRPKKFARNILPILSHKLSLPQAVRGRRAFRADPNTAVRSAGAGSSPAGGRCCLRTVKPMPALRARPLRSYVSAALVSERERVRRQHLPPADALSPRPAKSHKIYCFANTLVLSWEWILLTGGFL